LSIIDKILSFGIVINVSTFSFKLSNPSIDFPILFCHSNENGFVTTHTVKAQSSLANSAITGAAQVPVPPQRPQVINTISAHSKAALISSLDSSAAFLPISGSLQAPRPQVIILPMFILVGARLEYKACASVFIAINSTHSKPASIILLTALLQPQPTQITFILATGEIVHAKDTSSAPEVFPFQLNKFFNLSSLLTIILFLKIKLYLFRHYFF
jgi:hypothetical protein